MPALAPHYDKVVFYLIGIHRDTGGRVPIGTGVLVCRQSDSRHALHIYGVSAHHAIKDSVAIRLNNQLGHFVDIDIDAGEWTFMPNWDDLAAVDLTRYLLPSNFDFAVVDDSEILAESFAPAIRVGEDGFMLGLFVPQPGETRNVPAARFGCVSILASTNNPVEQGNKIKRPSYVFEMHSRPGYSGSPVFVYRTPAHLLGWLDKNGNAGAINGPGTFLRLLGIHSGQFRDSVEVELNGNYIVTQESGEPDTALVPSSMTVIVPAYRIKELLDLPNFINARAVRESGASRHPMQAESVDLDHDPTAKVVPPT